MARLLQSPWTDAFGQLLDSASCSLVLCSPFIGAGPCRELLARSSRGLWNQDFDVLILTDLSRDNMLSGSTDVGAVAGVAASIPGARVRFLPSLHAKVYIADETSAIITSGNMTDSGLMRNLEYGCLFSEPSIVGRIRQDVLQYAGLASPISQEQLHVFSRIVGELREIQKAAERSAKNRIRREFDLRLRKADDEILRARAAGRRPHSIFADAIRHILRSGSMNTAELHRRVQRRAIAL